MKFFAKVTPFDINQVDKTIYKVDKTYKGWTKRIRGENLFIFTLFNYVLSTYSPIKALGLIPYIFAKQRVKYFGSLNPTL